MTQPTEWGGVALLESFEVCHCLSALGQAVFFFVVILVRTARPKAVEQWHVRLTSRVTPCHSDTSLKN